MTTERSRRLSAKAISTWRAISNAVCRVASVVSRWAISQIAGPEHAEDDDDSAAKHGYLLLSQTHVPDRISDRQKPAKVRFYSEIASTCASRGILHSEM